MNKPLRVTMQMHENAAHGYDKADVWIGKHMKTQYDTIEMQIRCHLLLNESFTAVRVFDAVRKVHPKVGYRDVAEHIRDMYSFGSMAQFDYDRRLTEVEIGEGETIQAYLYFSRIKCSPPDGQNKSATPDACKSEACHPASRRQGGSDRRDVSYAQY